MILNFFNSKVIKKTKTKNIRDAFNKLVGIK